MKLLNIIFCLLAATSALTQAAPTPQALAEASAWNPTRILAGWLAIPEHQLTPLNHAKNSLPWLTHRAYNELMRNLLHRVDLQNRHIVEWFAFFTTIFFAPPMLEKIHAQTAIATTAPMHGFVPTNEQLRNVLPLATFKQYGTSGIVAKDQKTEYLWPSSIRYLFETQRIVSRFNYRRTLLPRIKSLLPCTASRTVPQAMRGQKYIVIESPMGYLVRNARTLLKASVSIAAALNKLFDVLKAPDEAVAPQQRARGAIATIHTPTAGGQPSGFGLFCNMLFRHSTTALGKLSTLNNATKFSESGKRICWVKILTQLPWASHLYILESDLRKLPLSLQTELYQLASEDALDAVETINNAFMWLYKNDWHNSQAPAHNQREITRTLTGQPQLPAPQATPPTYTAPRGQRLGGGNTPDPAPNPTYVVHTANDATAQLTRRTLTGTRHSLQDTNVLEIQQTTGRAIRYGWCTTCNAYHSHTGAREGWTINDGAQLPQRTVAQRDIYGWLNFR